MEYKYHVRLRLKVATTEIPVRIKGEEVEKTVKCFNVDASIYDLSDGSLVREVNEEGIQVVEINGLTRILPESLENVRVLSTMVSKGVAERKGSMLKIY